MRRRKLLIVAGALSALIVILVGIVVVYVLFADLSGYRDAAAQLASDAIGRRLRIDGDFDLEIGRTSNLVAANVALANPEWSDEREMVTVDRVAVSLNLFSLVRGPIRVHRIDLDGVRVWLEKDGEGRSSWDFDTGSTSDDGEKGPPPQLIIETVALSDLGFSFADPSRSQPLQARVKQLSVRSDDSGMLDLDVEGAFSDVPFALDGDLGPLMGLIQGGDVKHRLSGSLAELEFTTTGRFGELFALQGVQLSAMVKGSDLKTASERFGVGGLQQGPFLIQAQIEPRATAHRVSVEVEAAGARVTAQSTVDSFIRPSMVEVEVAGAGPDVTMIAHVLDLDEVKPEPFEVSGRVRWQGFPVRFDDVELKVGENTLSADGVLGAPPRMLATDFTFSGAGPDLSVLAAVVGIALPSQAYSLSGRVLRREAGVQVEDVEARVGRSTLQTHGFVGDAPAYDGTDLRFHAAGPRLADFRLVAGVDLPATSFEVDGRLRQGDGKVDLDGVRARVGNLAMQVEGGVATSPRLVGTDVRVQLSSPDPSWTGAFVGTELVPAEPIAARGRLLVEREGLRLRGLSASVGGLLLEADGVVGRARGLVGTELTLHVEGPEASRLAGVTRLQNLPREPFSVTGRLGVADDALVLDDVNGVVGSVDVRADGRIALTPGVVGSTVRVHGRGSHLMDLGVYLDQPGWPDEPFSVRAAVHVAEGRYDLERVEATVARNTAEVSGSLIPSNGLVGTDLRLDLRGPDLTELGAIVGASDRVELPPLPAEPYSLVAQVIVQPDHYEVKWLEVTLGAADATIAGSVGLPPSFTGTDLTVICDGPNAGLITALTGVSVPAAPFQLNGRVQRFETSTLLDSVSIRLGQHSANLSGILGDPPLLVGTDLDLDASGPSLALLEQLAGLPEMPLGEVSVSGHFEGTPEQFHVQDLEARLGDSDIAGSIQVDLRERPELSGELRSRRLDLAAHHSASADGEEDVPEPEITVQDTPKNGFVISDKAFDLDFLKKVNGDLVYNVAHVLLPRTHYRDVEIDVHLEDGRLQIGPFDATGEYGGRLEARMQLEPEGEGYSVGVGFDLTDAKIDLSAAEDHPDQWPTFDLSVEVDSVGRTPHQMASSLNGRMQLVVGEGTVENSLIDLLAADILRELLLTFNPFIKEEKTTRFNCGVVVATAEDGRVTLDPVAVQTEKVTVLGDGKIDFATEKLDVDWVTKPRKGLGVSASNITNPYIKLGGTLANPRIEIKPMQALASTSVAVATGGLSLLGKGFWDRITAGRKVCKRALERAEKNASQQD